MIIFFQQRKISWFSFVDDNSIHFTAKEQKNLGKKLGNRIWIDFKKIQ